MKMSIEFMAKYQNGFYEYLSICQILQCLFTFTFLFQYDWKNYWY